MANSPLVPLAHTHAGCWEKGRAGEGCALLSPSPSLLLLLEAVRVPHLSSLPETGIIIGAGACSSVG